MASHNEFEQLCTIYADQSDEQLLDLHEQREDLTENAQQALAQVMRDRGLHGVDAGADEDEPEASAETEAAIPEDHVLIYMFTDAFEAREAIRHLTNAEIEHSVQDWHVIEPKMQPSPTGLDLGLVVAKQDRARSLQILKDKLGLFPAAEGDDGSDGLNPVEGFELLSMFELQDALVAAQALGEAGVSYLWRDGRDARQELPDEETVAIEVRGEEMARATQLVEAKLSLLD